MTGTVANDLSAWQGSLSVVLGVVVAVLILPLRKLGPKSVIMIDEPGEVALLDLKSNLLNLSLVVIVHVSNSSGQHIAEVGQLSGVGGVVLSTVEVLGLLNLVLDRGEVVERMGDRIEGVSRWWVFGEKLDKGGVSVLVDSGLNGLEIVPVSPDHLHANSQLILLLTETETPCLEGFAHLIWGLAGAIKSRSTSSGHVEGE